MESQLEQSKQSQQRTGMKDNHLLISKFTIKQQQSIQCDYTKRVKKKKKNRQTSTESPELNFYNYGQLISDKCTKTI